MKYKKISDEGNEVLDSMTIAIRSLYVPFLNKCVCIVLTFLLKFFTQSVLLASYESLVKMCLFPQAFNFQVFCLL